MASTSSGPTIIMDNGAHSIKIGFAFDLKEPPEPPPAAPKTTSPTKPSTPPASASGSPSASAAAPGGQDASDQAEGDAKPVSATKDTEGGEGSTSHTSGTDTTIDIDPRDPAQVRLRVRDKSEEPPTPTPTTAAQTQSPTGSPNGKSASIAKMCLLMPNCIAKAKSERRRPFIANQIDDCRDTSGLFFILPFQRGYMCAPQVQKTVWDHIFGENGLKINFGESNLIITEPLFNFQSVQDLTCEILFEDYGFNSVCRTTAPHLVDYNYATNNTNLEGESNVCTLVVDSGHSFTHIIPFINGQKVTNAIRRIDVGGKALTNHLKELISYRQIHVLDETYLMNQVKEDVCYVSNDFNEGMRIARLRYPENTIYREYVLPDYTTIKRGYIRSPSDTGKRPADGEQILKMNNERFSIPELLFNPSDIGIKQMGTSDLIHEVIQTFPHAVQSHFYKNIVLVGGNANFPGFRDRVYSDVRTLAREDVDVQVHVDENPTTYAWYGGNKLAHDPELVKYTVTRDQYLSEGMAAFAKVSDI